MSNCSQNCWIDWNSAVLCFKRLFHIGVWTFARFVRPLLATILCVWEYFTGWQKKKITKKKQSVSPHRFWNRPMTPDQLFSDTALNIPCNVSVGGAIIWLTLIIFQLSFHFQNSTGWFSNKCLDSKRVSTLLEAAFQTWPMLYLPFLSVSRIKETPICSPPTISHNDKHKHSSLVHGLCGLKHPNAGLSPDCAHGACVLQQDTWL